MRTWHDESRAEAIMERKLRLVKEQASIVLAPKMPGYAPAHPDALYGGQGDQQDADGRRYETDAPPELEAASERIVKFTQKVRGFTGALGGQSLYLGFGSDPREKEILARRRNAYVFMPKTAEGATLANLFISLDSAYCEFKIKSPLHDIARLGEAIDTMRRLAREFHEFTSDLVAKTRIRLHGAGRPCRVPEERPDAGEET